MRIHISTALAPSIALAVLGLAAPAIAQCVLPADLSMRVGRPLVVRGPTGIEIDTPFNVIKLESGGFRGFTANQTSYRVDGLYPWAMGGPATSVMGAGPADSFYSCGRWLNDTEKLGSSLVHGFVHAETACNYAIGQTHKSFAFTTSANEGLDWWSTTQQVITGTDAPAYGRHTGEGDCTVVNGQDGYYYAYCLRGRDWSTIVARAPVANPGPGEWWKYYGGAWSQPGLGGDATALGFLGMGAARWTSRDAVLLLGVWDRGLNVSVSCDKINFTTLPEPLLPLEDNNNWVRPASTELVAYPSMLNYTDGNNQVRDTFLLSHMYLEPGADFTQRYLVMRDVSIGARSSPTAPQMGIALSRWYNAAARDRWTTTGPVPGNYAGYAYEGVLGYLMTQPHPTLATNKLEECSSTWTGHPEHMLTNDGTCTAGNGYTRLRTAGWVYVYAQPDTVPLYRCWNGSELYHFASTQADCEGLGTMEWRLGYALAY
jgi:hypothetical protein